MPRLKGKGRDVVTARNNFVLKLVKCSESHDYAAQKRCHFLNFHANDPLYKFAKVIRKILGMIQPHSIGKHVICKSFLLSFYGIIVNNGYQFGTFHKRSRRIYGLPLVLWKVQL